MASKSKTIVKKHFLIAWQDSDVPDQIRDRSFAGRLANNNTNNKENQQPDNKTQTNENAAAGGKSLLKRRVSKRASLATTAAAAANTTTINDLNLDQLTVSGDTVSSTSKPSLATGPVGLNRVGAHFVFGNQAADGTTMSSKTSNNKLEQSHRISYHEMSTVLSAHRNELVDQTIESLNHCYEEKFFPEWFRLMRFVFFFVYNS